MGNASEVSAESLQQEFGSYLMDGEKITTGFKLIRDAIVITDRRILSFDKQGTTGQKMRVDSIYLQSVVYVTAETAGIGLDDSEITLTYIETPNLKAHSVNYSTKHIEFPKKYDIQGLYKMFQELAYQNFLRLNSL